jgi:hypothetical protein
MTTQSSHHRSRRWMAAGAAGHRLSRLATVLATAISGLLVSAVAATAAFANPIPIGEQEDVTPIQTVPVTRTVVVGGMPGWQIALIAIGAALAGAGAAVLAYRSWPPATASPPPPDAHPQPPIRPA